MTPLWLVKEIEIAEEERAAKLRQIKRCQSVRIKGYQSAFLRRHDEEMLFPRNEEIDSQNKVHLVSLRIPEKFKNFHSSRRTPLANANFYRKKRDSGSTAAAAAAAAFAAHRPRNKKGIKGKQIELQLQKYR